MSHVHNTCRLVARITWDLFLFWYTLQSYIFFISTVFVALSLHFEVDQIPYESDWQHCLNVGCYRLYSVSVLHGPIHVYCYIVSRLHGTIEGCNQACMVLLFQKWLKLAKT